MSIEFWAITEVPYLQLTAHPGGYLLAGAYTLALLIWLAQRLRDFSRLSVYEGILGFGLLILSPLLAEILVLRFPSGNLLTPPGVAADPSGPAFSALGAFPLIAAGGMLGVGPAIVVGYVGGLARAGWQTHSLLTPFETALAAGLIAWLLRQEYRGRLAAALRHPLLAGLTVSLTVWPFHFFSVMAYSGSAGLASMDYATRLVLASALPLVTGTTLGALAATVVRAAWPRWWPAPTRLRPAPYDISLNRRLLFSLIPLAVLGIAALFWADTQIAVRVSRDLVVDQMGRAAETVGWGVPFFVQTGRSLVRELAAAPDLQSGDALTAENELSKGMHTVPFFLQLAYFDSGSQMVASYPAVSVEALGLSPDELDAVTLSLAGVPQEITVPPLTPGSPVIFTFVSPVRAQGTGGVVGALLGRTTLSENPLMKPFVSRLQGLIAGQGEGFLVDELNRIVYHPDPQRLMTEFVPEPSARALATTVEGAAAYEDRYPDGSRRLVFYMPVNGHPWSVVVMVPHQVVLQQATQISTPMLVILILVGGVGLLIVLFVAGRLTRPLEMLAHAAGRMAEGRLDTPVRLSGEDEVGRLGLAFERMRESLQGRLAELNLLLRVSQGVAASLNPDESLPPILQGALAATGAAGVRLVLPPEGELSSLPTTPAYAAGPSASIMAPLDRDVLALTRDGGMAVIENLSRARAVLNVSAVAGRIHALLALPLKQQENYYGALWVGYTQPHTFSENEVRFLTTLAGQAAVAVSNANLFRAAESGRRRLAATLVSTPDAVVVTDNRNRLLLLNPPAETAFGIPNPMAVGRPVAEVIRHTGLARSLTEAGGEPMTVEVAIEGGRTLVASTSAIYGSDGSMLGRVSVLRDVTHFKEVDALKSEFVATVSHDLRAPLTLMRGYATMLPMVGPLNDKQKEFAEKIVMGVEQMTSLIEELLDLGRIEAGVGLELERIKIDEVVSGVANALNHQARIAGITIQVEALASLPPITADRTLLRQAITNLVENAIKYTRQGGEVRVRATIDGATMVISVKDTGIGIAPADQVRLFEKFYRVKQRENLAIRGSGLGLAIVKSVAERHGGKAWVESRLGQGSTFFILIPLDDHSAEPVGAAK